MSIKGIGLMNVELDKESPMEREFNKFDVEHLDWTEKDYIENALQTDPKYLNDLLIKEIHWRKDHGMNFVASCEGYQGKGKSMPFSYFAQLIGKIYQFPFMADNVYYAPEELDEALSHAAPRETFLRDEIKQMRGYMSNMIKDSLSDYEDQLRITQNNLLQCSVQLTERNHFFCFESKNIVWEMKDGKPYPKKFILILKTPRYTNRNQFVWRGFVSFPMPNEDYVSKYLERKNEHISRLKRKYGNTFNAFPFYASEIFKKRETDLIKENKEGFIVPIKSELIDMIISQEINLTVKGYSVLKSLIKNLIEKKYAEYNQKIFKELEEKQLQKKLSIKQQAEEEEEKAQKRRERKEKIILLKLEEEKRKNDLKEKALKLKQEELNLRKNPEKEVLDEEQPKDLNKS